MSEKRVTVWVQRFKDRPALVLQWFDPNTGRRKSKSAGTADEDAAETARADLEYELNHGKYQEASRMTWERFRELFEKEYLPNLRPNTRRTLGDAMNHLERICRPARLSSINERVLSAFAAGLRMLPGRGNKTMTPASVKSHLVFLRAVLRWAVDQGLLPKCPKL